MSKEVKDDIDNVVFDSEEMALALRDLADEPVEVTEGGFVPKKGQGPIKEVIIEPVKQPVAKADPLEEEEENQEDPFIPERPEVKLTQKVGRKPKKADPTSTDDDLSDEDLEVVGDNDSPNWKALVARHKEVKAKKQELQNQVEELSKYKDMYEFENSPEVHEKYKNVQNQLKNEGTIVAETYAVEGDVEKFFAQPNVIEARKLLDRHVTDKYANEELSRVITKFYANKVQEAKELQSNNPKDRLRAIKEELEQQKVNQDRAKLAALNTIKTKTESDIEVFLGSKEQGKKLFPAFYSEDVLESFSDDIPQIMIQETKKSFNAFLTALTKSGADINFEMGRALATQAMDATAGRLKEDVIATLIEKNKKLEKDLASFNKFANPKHETTSDVTRPAKNTKDLSNEERLGMAIANALGEKF